MPSKKISAMPSWNGNQVGSDLLTGVDLSQPAATQNVKTTLDLFFGNLPSRTILNPAAGATPTTPYFGVRTPADTALTADSEAVGIQLGGNAALGTVTRQFTAGAGLFATQREIVCVAPTYSATGAESIVEAATLAITGAPIAGTNISLLNSYALYVQSGKTVLSGSVTINPAARTGAAPTLFQIVTPADTALTASTENVLNQFGGTIPLATVTRQFATGALTTQRENVFVNPTYAFVGASTLTTAATVAITGAPAAGTNATITQSVSFWVQAGKTRFDGDLVGADTNERATLTVDASVAAGIPAGRWSFHPTGQPSQLGILQAGQGNAGFGGTARDVLVALTPDTSGSYAQFGGFNAAGTILHNQNNTNPIYLAINGLLLASINSGGLIQTRAGNGSTPTTANISLGGTFDVLSADVSVTGTTTETALSSTTVEANTLANNGDFLLVFSAVSTGSTGAAARQVRLRYGDSGGALTSRAVVIDSGSVDFPDSTDVGFYAVIIRTGATTARVFRLTVISSTVIASSPFADITVTHSNTNILSTTGQLTNTGDSIISRGLVTLKFSNQ